MNRAVLLIPVLLLIALAGISQKPRFGIDLGFSVNQGKFSAGSGTDPEERIFGGFDGGLLLEFRLSGNWKLQPELSYTITGVELNDGTNENTLKLQYLSIPILVKYSIGRKF